MSMIWLLAVLLGAPLFAVIAAVAFQGFYQEGVDLSVEAIEFWRLTELPALEAIPFFTFAGYLLSESGAPARLVRLSDALLGWMPGGLVVVTIVGSAFFTAFTGASGVTIIALGALLYPALVQAGYGQRFSLGLVTSAGSMGLLFAPALPLILYGVVAQQTLAQLGQGGQVGIDQMFRAGVLPGLLMVVLLALWSIRQAPAHKDAVERPALSAVLGESAWELPLPVLVLGGIYGGWFAVSEAAAVTAVYVLVVEVGIRREIPWRALPRISRESMLLVGAILLILGVSLASTNLMVDRGVPEQLFQWLSQRVSSAQTFLWLLLGFLLLLGMLLDIFSALVLVVPMILPLGLAYGIHPVHLGVIFLAAMQFGYLTPPVGMNLFIAAWRFEQPVLQVYRASLSFFLVLLLAVVLIAFWPALSLFWVQ